MVFENGCFGVTTRSLDSVCSKLALNSNIRTFWSPKLALDKLNSALRFKRGRVVTLIVHPKQALYLLELKQIRLGHFVIGRHHQQIMGKN